MCFYSWVKHSCGHTSHGADLVGCTHACGIASTWAPNPSRIHNGPCARCVALMSNTANVYYFDHPQAFTHYTYAPVPLSPAAAADLARADEMRRRLSTEPSWARDQVYVAIAQARGRGMDAAAAKADWVSKWGSYYGSSAIMIQVAGQI